MVKSCVGLWVCHAVARGGEKAAEPQTGRLPLFCIASAATAAIERRGGGASGGPPVAHTCAASARASSLVLTCWPRCMASTLAAPIRPNTPVSPGVRLERKLRVMLAGSGWLVDVWRGGAPEGIGHAARSAAAQRERPALGSGGHLSGERGLAAEAQPIGSWSITYVLSAVIEGSSTSDGELRPMNQATRRVGCNSTNETDHLSARCTCDWLYASRSAARASPLADSEW